MPLGIKSTLRPMEALPAGKVPTGEMWQYEPKWDGFRCLAFREGGRIHLKSKSGQPLGRYFPEIIESLKRLKPKQFVLDGEIVIPIRGRLSFNHLLMRIHPAESRVRMLATEHPATLIIFDLLAGELGTSLLQRSLKERRQLLELFAAKYLRGDLEVRLSPATLDVRVAKKWLKGSGGALDGIIAKRLDLPYRAGLRDGMQKIKQHHTVDCVVGGFRYAAGKRVVGSLLLGLYNAEGTLDHVGFTSSIKASDRAKITSLIEPLISLPGFTGRAPGGPSRWSTKRSSEWQPLQPKLVVEVIYDHFTGGRFRHGTKLSRWRPDKTARACKIDQVTRLTGTSLKILDGV